jgi:hypothetical protein
MLFLSVFSFPNPLITFNTFLSMHNCAPSKKSKNDHNFLIKTLTATILAFFDNSVRVLFRKINCCAYSSDSGIIGFLHKTPQQSVVVN